MSSNYGKIFLIVSRNPNEPQETDLSHGIRQERNRFKNIEWIAYEGVHKKYLNLGESLKSDAILFIDGSTLFVKLFLKKIFFSGGGVEQIRNRK